MTFVRLGVAALVILLLAGTPSSGEDTLSWADCVRLAAENSPALIASRRQVETAEVSVGIARSALLPQLSAGASASRSDRDGAGAASDTSYSASVSVDQSLYSGGRNQASIRAARASLERTTAAGDDTGAQLTYDLRAAFVDVLYAGEQVALLHTIEARRRENLELVELRYEGGREHKGSLASSRASLFDAQVQVKQATRRTFVNRSVLCRTIGIESMPQGTGISGSMNEVAIPKDGPIETIAKRTPTFRASLASVAAAEADLAGARGGYRPSLSLSGSAARSGDNDAFEDDSWAVGLKLSLPLWSGGKTGHEVTKARAAVAAANADLADTFNGVINSLAEARQGLMNAVEDVEVQEKYLEAAETRAEIARQQYEDGLLSFENWVVIEDDLVNRKKQLLDARRSAMRAEASWWRATGRSVFRGMETSGDDDS